MVGQGTSLATAIGSASNVSAPSNMAEWMYSGAFGDAVYVGFHSNGSTGDPNTATARGAVGLIDSDQGTPHQANLALYLGRQINQDMQALPGVFEHNWSNRTTHTFTSGFGEIDLGSNAEMDATIIEVAFHDNIQDGALLRDPKVRDQLARSTYQGTLEYFDVWGGLNSPTSLPTAPTNVRVVSNASGEATINWSAGASTPVSVNGAAPTGYRVYASVDGYGFDGGTFVDGAGTTSATLTGFDPARPYYFRVAAVNAGGESKPSEVMTALPSGGAKQVLIVNGFDRFDRTQDFAYPYAFTGDGLVDRVWSRYNNSFDYVVQVHNAIHAADPGLHVASTSNEAVISGAVNLGDYDAVIWILGEESTADDTFNATEQSLVEAFIAAGGNLFTSGAEIAWDLDQQNNGRTFFENTLKGNYAADDGGTYNITPASGSIFAGMSNFSFSNGNAFSQLDSQYYNAATPDVINPQAGASAALTYNGGTNGTAAIQVQGTGGRGSVVMFGFPFESITNATRRSEIMERVLDFFSVSATMPAINVVTQVSGQDADSPPGPVLDAGSTVIFTYTVTNPGNIALNGVVVTDDNGTPGNAADDFNPTFAGGDTNSNNQLDVDETWTYTALRSVGEGAFAGSASVSGTAASQNVSDSDAAHYFGSTAEIIIELFVDGQAAHMPPGPSIAVGTVIPFSYIVTNPGNLALSGVTVTDNNGTPEDTADDFMPVLVYGDTNFNSMLDTDEIWTFLAAHTVTLGEYANLATATGTDGAIERTDEDQSHHVGIALENADFNGDSSVDAADYVVWRKFSGTTVPTGTLGDANSDTEVNDIDFDIWQEQFGTTVGGGSGGAALASSATTTHAERSVDIQSVQSANLAFQDAAITSLATTNENSRSAHRSIAELRDRLAWTADDSEWGALLAAIAGHIAEKRDMPDSADYVGTGARTTERSPVGSQQNDSRLVVGVSPPLPRVPRL
jgi:hypothetical protein